MTLSCAAPAGWSSGTMSSRASRTITGAPAPALAPAPAPVPAPAPAGTGGSGPTRCTTSAPARGGGRRAGGTATQGGIFHRAHSWKFHCTSPPREEPRGERRGERRRSGNNNTVHKEGPSPPPQFTVPPPPFPAAPGAPGHPVFLPVAGQPGGVVQVRCRRRCTGVGVHCRCRCGGALQVQVWG